MAGIAITRRELTAAGAAAIPARAPDKPLEVWFQE